MYWLLRVSYKHKPIINIYLTGHMLSFSYLDIVQEGLDIPTCSYVIRYEFVSDEIGTIQSRGRARAQNSSYYLITELESVNHRREKNNKIREENMEIIIAEWPSFDKDAFHRDVETKAVNNKSLLTLL